MTEANQPPSRLDDPHYIQPPQCQFHYAEPRWNLNAGFITCGWGEIFDATWKSLFHSSTWMNEVLYRVLQDYAHTLTGVIYEVCATFQESGPYFQVEPGNACDAGAYPDTCDNITCRIGCHNVDNPHQMFALYTLMCIWFSAVAEISTGRSSAEEAQHILYHDRDQQEDCVVWKFRAPSKKKR